MELIDLQTVRVYRDSNRKAHLLPKPFDANVVLAEFEGEDDSGIARFLGVHRSTVYRWRTGKQNMLNAYIADRLAMRLGKHPAQLWGNLWWSTAGDEEDLLEAANG